MCSMLQEEVMVAAQKWVEASGGYGMETETGIACLQTLAQDIEICLSELPTDTLRGQPVFVAAYAVLMGQVQAALAVTRHSRQLPFQETAGTEGQPVYVAALVDKTEPPDLVLGTSPSYFLAEKLKLTEPEPQTVLDTNRSQDGIVGINLDAFAQGRVWTTDPEGKLVLGTVNEEYLETLSLPIIAAATGEELFPHWVIPD